MDLNDEKVLSEVRKKTNQHFEDYGERQVEFKMEFTQLKDGNWKWYLYHFGNLKGWGTDTVPEVAFGHCNTYRKHLLGESSYPGGPKA